MCMFSAPVEHVCKTRIFARMLEGSPAKQALIYAMQLRTRSDVAMILPVPTPAGASEDALRFVSLEGHARFFDALDELFPTLEQPDPFATDLSDPEVPRAAPQLVVHRVGAFEASFVPSRADFVRLDPRFRLPDEVLAGLPYDETWGYAVFKLRGSASESAAPGPEQQGLLARLFGRRPPAHVSSRALEQDIHPMAFVFETRQPRALFFPTIHVHAGRLPELAAFDHQLYFQSSGPTDPVDFMLPSFELIRPDPASTPWPEGFDPRIQVLHETAGAVGERLASAPLVDAGARAYRYSLVGDGPNRDLEIMLGVGPG